MFSQACVMNSVHNGECIPACNGQGMFTPGQTSALGRHPSWADTPPWSDTPRPDTPPGRHPPPFGMATDAGGTHPTGMHCSWGIFSIRYLRYNFMQK